MPLVFRNGCLVDAATGTKLSCSSKSETQKKRADERQEEEKGGTSNKPGGDSPSKPPGGGRPSNPSKPSQPPTPSSTQPQPGQSPGGLLSPTPGDSAAISDVRSGSGDNSTGGVNGPAFGRTVGSSITGKGANFLRNALYGKGAKPTLSELPRQGVYAAELCNVGYQLVEEFGPTKGTSKVTMEGFAKAMTSNMSAETHAYVGELLPEFSDSNILIFRRGDGHLTAATRGTYTKSMTEVAFDAGNIALMNNAGNSNLFNSRYYKTLDAVRAKYGKPVDVIMGDSLGAHVAISATDRGLANRSVALNPYIRPSEVGAGYHTILRTPGDPALLSSANLNLRESTEAANLRMGENTQLHVVPETLGKTNSILPHERLASRVAQHSTYNFLPEHSGLAVEQGDSLAPTRAQRAAMAEANMQAEARAAGSARYTDTATLLEKGPIIPDRVKTVGATVGSFAAGQVIGYVGAVASDKALTSLGVDNTFARDVVDGAAANVTADVALTGASAAYAAATGGAVAGIGASAVASSGVLGASAGMGAYAGSVVADELGLEGAGATALEVTGAGVNTVLAAILLTGPENPAAWAAAAVLATEGALLWVDSLFHSHDEMSQEQYDHYRSVNLERNINFHMREEALRRNLIKMGIDFDNLTFLQKHNLYKMARTSDLSDGGYAQLKAQLAKGGKLTAPTVLSHDEQHVAAYMAKVGVDWNDLTPEERQEAVNSQKELHPSAYASHPEVSTEPVAPVRQMDISVPIATY